MRSLARCTAAWLLCVCLQPTFADETDWQGRKLSDFLDALNVEGLRVIYSSDLVDDGLILGTDPGSGDPRDVLRDVLRPFGLSIAEGPAGSLLVVRDESPGPLSAMPAAELQPVPIPEIIVTSSLHRLEYADPETHTYLDRELATRIPTVADEAVRLTNRLPGTASGGVSSRNHVRGGEVNETLFLFDGLRLYEPYHLKDFQSIATIVNSNAIGGMDFFTGAYPARYGDRMSGVLSIELREPAKPIETELALSFFNTSLLSMGTFGGHDRGDWLVTARRGNLDLVVDVVDPDIGSPNYQDYLTHVGWAFTPDHHVGVDLLVSDDKVSLRDADRGEQASASYTNQVVWARWRAGWNERWSSDTIIAVSDITNRRAGTIDLPGIVAGDLSDFLEFSAIELRQDWTWVPARDWMLRFGFDLKDLDAAYRFQSQKSVAPPFDGILDNQAMTTFDFDVAPSGAQYAAYGEFRWRFLPTLTADVGLRWDQQSYTTAENDRQYSPRAGILWQPGDRTELRFGWGQYYQAQEINELQISDGVDRFFPAQRAEHFVLNLKFAFDANVDLDLSVYRKSFRTVHPRFENAFNTLTLLPELQFDRVRVAPTGAEAIGAEFMLTRGTASDDLFWWLGYSWSEIEDQLDTGDVMRSWDQTHTVKAGISWRWGAWDFSAAAEAHTGWPETVMTGALVTLPGGTQQLELDVGERNATRYTAFHTFDVRVSREFQVGGGELTTFLEISNLYDRDNPCCTEYSLAADGSLQSRETDWLPLVPSLGILWRF